MLEDEDYSIWERDTTTCELLNGKIVTVNHGDGLWSIPMLDGWSAFVRHEPRTVQ